MALTQAQFEAQLAERLDMPKRQVQDILDQASAMVADELANDGSARVRGLGTFKVHIRPAQPERQGRNPQTGAPITIPAKPAQRKLKVLPSSELKAALAE